MTKKVLVFAPHNDDELLGVGGTIKKLSLEGYEVFVCEITSSYRASILQSEAKNAHAILGVKETFFLNLPVVDLNLIEKSKINKLFSEIVNKIEPQIVFIPHVGDIHLDHQVVNDAAMVALRPYSAKSVEQILVYETLSETEWNIPNATNAFLPNTFYDISKELNIKKEAMKCYKSQLNNPPHPRSIEAIDSLARLRGSTIGVEAAEAFMLIRNIVK